MAGLCLLLGFAIVLQVRQTQGDELAGMRQDDLVRLLDEITQRNEALAEEAEELREDRAALLGGSDASRSAEDYLEIQQILAGVAPVEGPGVIVTVDGTAGVTAQNMVHMLEELRNAGAEAIELSGVRVVAGTYFLEDGGELDCRRRRRWATLTSGASSATPRPLQGRWTSPAARSPRSGRPVPMSRSPPAISCRSPRSAPSSRPSTRVPLRKKADERMPDVPTLASIHPQPEGKVLDIVPPPPPTDR